jgi:regulator of protease activity HflC (stomatin/prohibitin superfamily)
MIAFLLANLWILIVIALLMGIKIINEYQRGIVFTLWRFTNVLWPGLKVVIPIIQRVVITDIREKAVDVPSQEAMTRDNISCSINAVIYYKVKSDEVEKSLINVKNIDYAMSQFAQTSMRNIVGQFELDQLLSDREAASAKIKEVIDEKSNSRWVDVLAVEIKDINLPEDLKRVIGKQAEAEREKRAKIITSEGELASANNLKMAAELLGTAPWALHLRTLQSINDISSDQSNTTVWMVPIEVLKAVEWINKMLHEKNK